MRIWLLLQFFGVALAGMPVTSCSVQSGEELNSEPSFVGFVTAIDRNETGGAIPRLTVESHADKLVRRHVVSLNKETVVLRRESGALRPVDISTLKLKDWVQLWFAGSRREPYPLEVSARQVVIIDRP